MTKESILSEKFTISLFVVKKSKTVKTGTTRKIDVLLLTIEFQTKQTLKCEILLVEKFQAYC
ncbi:hypothetical protein T10_9833 [Trichinella papuae]|uniref:Uncharacterized protein n=1 Tax=Trichinella papuae TaxID=268474 RepID=A0A0V1N2W1_9BILA|nr:hypothetical protein T10_9833 [Trichinella papuae]